MGASLDSSRQRVKSTLVTKTRFFLLVDLLDFFSDLGSRGGGGG